MDLCFQVRYPGGINMDKTIIKIRYRWGYLQHIVLAFLSIFMLVTPRLFVEVAEDEHILEIIWYIFFSAVTVMFFIFCFTSYETAELTEEYIIIKSKFRTIKTIKWRDLVNVQIVDLPTGTAGYSIIYKEWIVLYTDLKQCENSGGVNKSKKGPWYIANINDNCQIIKKYIDNYNLGIDTNLEFDS